jgi:hypothetical protein
MENKRRLETREAIEAYISENGFICLKQDATADSGDPDSIIAMMPHDVPLIIKWLQDILKEVESEKKN